MDWKVLVLVTTSVLKGEEDSTENFYDIVK